MSTIINSPKDTAANTYLFYKVCKVHDTFYFGGLSYKAEKSKSLSFKHCNQKLMSYISRFVTVMALCSYMAPNWDETTKVILFSNIFAI